MESDLLDNELDDSIFDDLGELDLSVASNILLENSTLNASFVSEVGERPPPLSQSTPRKPVRTPFTAPAPKPLKQRLPCHKCSNTYANERTLAVHLKMHAMKSVSSRTPNQAEMDQLTKEAIIKSCQEIQAEKCQRGTGLELVKFCACTEKCVDTGVGEALVCLFSQSFSDILKGQNILLPSALRNVVHRSTTKKLHCNDFRLKMKEILKSIIADASSQVLNLFVGCVGLKVFTWLLVFVLRAFQGQSSEGEVSLQQCSPDDSHPEQYRQLIFYIGGAVLKDILKKAKLHSNNPDWTRLGEITKRKFVAEPFVHASNVCDASVISFTAGRDRGGLTYCNEEAFNFFILLFTLIRSVVEGADNALPLERVESVALNNDGLIFMWDDIVGLVLTEDQSAQMFSDVVRCCAKIVVRGILKRKLNEHLAKSYSSVALRNRVAR